MELLLELNNKINEMLDECSSLNTPTVCNFISTKEGKEAIVTLIQKKIIQEKMTIGQAINSIEMEYNINGTES